MAMEMVTPGLKLDRDQDHLQVCSSLMLTESGIRSAPSPLVGPVMTSHPRSKSHRLKSATGTPSGLVPFFWLAANAPRIVRLLQPLAIRLVPLASRSVRRHTQCNALRIFGRALGRSEQRAFTRAVVNNFYEFVIDVGDSGRVSAEQLLARIGRVEGEQAYRTMRAGKLGAVLVTAHLGSFEVGLAALRRVEPRVHVVFQRDATDFFESMRAKMRYTLGIIEAPIDDGIATWMNLRNALLNGDVVVMQADRAMSGQRAAVVPFLHGHLRVPTGAVRLARLTGCPIVPVFTVRSAPQRFVVHLFPAIDPGRDRAVPDSNDTSLLAVGSAIESMVAKYPTQWLVLGPAFEEDAASV